MRRRLDVSSGPVEVMRWVLGLVIALVVTIALATPAKADDADLQYYDLLRGMGATNIDFLLARKQGLQSCVMLDSGYTMAQTVDDLMRAGPYSFAEATYMTIAAITAYCPWNDPGRGGSSDTEYAGTTSPGSRPVDRVLSAPSNPFGVWDSPQRCRCDHRLLAFRKLREESNEAIAACRYRDCSAGRTFGPGSECRAAM